MTSCLDIGIRISGDFESWPWTSFVFPLILMGHYFDGFDIG